MKKWYVGKQVYILQYCFGNRIKIENILCPILLKMVTTVHLIMCSSYLLFEYQITFHCVMYVMSVLSSFFLPLCPLFFRWWVGGWQKCTATCGSDGVRKRTVLCVRTVSGEERVLHSVECKHLSKPKPILPCNRDVPCGHEWAIGAWEEVNPFPVC